MPQPHIESDQPRDGTPAGFGRGVNQYLNTAVAFADAKATAFLAASLTVAAGLMEFQNSTSLGIVLRPCAIALLAAAIATNAFAIIPRLGSARRGLVFWDDIRSYPDLDDYLQATASLTPTLVETEFAAQNYFVAGIAQRKHLWVRRGIWLFLAGLSATIGAYIVH